MNKRMKFFTLFLFVILIVASLIVDFESFASDSIGSNLKNESTVDKIENNNSEQMEHKVENKYKVVIDPGHGGKDVGAHGVSGQYEKDFTLSLSKKVENLLDQEPQIEVFMTRTDDSFISQESRYRPKYANELNADLFISIHGNTFEDSNVSGTEVYYYHKNSRHFAEILQKHVVEATGFRDRGIKKQDFFVVKDTE